MRLLLNGVVAPPQTAAGSDSRPIHKHRDRRRLVLGLGGFMSEVVVQISAEETRDPSRLTHALDAFAKWAAEAGLSTESGDAPDIMMMTEHTGGEMRRKLVFQHRDHAARFLVFWRTERHRYRMPEGVPASA